MRLRSFRIRGFRCIEDSGTITVGDLAALIGSNESGKTALLQGLLLLNKDSVLDEVDLTDGLDAELMEPEFRIAEGRFELTPEEMRSLAAHAEGSPEMTELTIYRLPGSTQPEYEFGTGNLPPVYRLQEPNVSSFQEHLDAFVSQGRQRLVSASSTTALTNPNEAHRAHSMRAGLQSILDRAQRLKEADKLSASEIDEFVSQVEAWANNGDTDSDLQRRGKSMVSVARNLFKEMDGRSEIEEFIRTKLHPRFVYFCSYKTVHGAVRLSEYLGGATGGPLTERLDSGENLDKRETIDNLFFLAQLDPKYLDSLRTQIAAQTKYLRRCSQLLTNEIQKNWVREDGTKAVCEIHYGDNILRIIISDVHPDGRQTNKQLLQRRSEGFRWQFSFQVNFRAETKKAELKEAILLLDEPGLHLHPAQQEGLLAVIRELSRDNQILYTTHSPFMIFNYEEGDLLLVENDPATHLSRVSPAFWRGEATSIVPILHSLGAPSLNRVVDTELAKELPPMLVLDGRTPFQYIRTLNWLFRKHLPTEGGKRTVLDFELVPANGAAAVGPSALLNSKIGYKVVALFEGNPEGRTHAEELKRQRFADDQILLIETEGKGECDIEDIFPESFYLSAVNDVYKPLLRSAKYSAVTKEDLQAPRKANPGLTRIVPLLEGLWEAHKANGWGNFSRSAICERICVDMLQNRRCEEVVANRVQRLFDRIAKVFPIASSTETIKAPPAQASAAEPGPPPLPTVQMKIRRFAT